MTCRDYTISCSLIAKLCPGLKLRPEIARFSQVPKQSIHRPATDLDPGISNTNITKALVLILTSSNKKLWSNAIINISGLNTFTLTHCGWPTAFATASHYSLPPSMCSLVPGCWLGFTWAGLSSLIILALLGAL